MSADVRWSEQLLAEASEEGLTVSIVHVPGGRASAVLTTGGSGSCNLQSVLLRLGSFAFRCWGTAALAAALALDAGVGIRLLPTSRLPEYVDFKKSHDFSPKSSHC